MSLSNKKANKIFGYFYKKVCKKTRKYAGKNAENKVGVLK